MIGSWKLDYGTLHPYGRKYGRDDGPDRFVGRFWIEMMCHTWHLWQFRNETTLGLFGFLKKYAKTPKTTKEPGDSYRNNVFFEVCGKELKI